MAKATLKKSERIKQRKLISKLFEEGKSIRKYPIKVVYFKLDEPLNENPLLFSVSVPKRLFKKAVQRNLLKRKIREAYRLEKPIILKQLDGVQKQYALMFIYIARELEEFPNIQKAVRKLLKALVSEISHK